MSVKTVNTRIKSKYDLLATWQSSTLEILPGEITVAYLPTRTTDPLQTTKPSFLLKVGVDFPIWVGNTSYGVGDTVTYNSVKYRCITANSDASFTSSKWSANHTGTSTAIQYGLYWSELPFTSALAADVYNWAKAANKPTYSYTEITNFATGVRLNDHQYKIVETSAGSGKFDLKVSTDNGSTWSAISGSAQIDISALDTDTNTVYRFNSTQPTTGVYQLQLESQEKGSSTWNVVSNSSFQIKESTSSGKITIVTTNTSGTSVSVDVPVHNVVTTDGAQTISGNKTFTGTVTVPTPSNSTDAANKNYVDTEIAKIDQFKYIVSTNAANTPQGVVWHSGSTTITGTLVPSASTEFTIYLVPDDSDPGAPGDFIEYLTIQPVAGTYVWEKIGTTSTDLSGYSKYDYRGKYSATTAGNVTTVTYRVQRAAVGTSVSTDTGWSNYGDLLEYTIHTDSGIITLPDGTSTYTTAAIDAQIPTVTISNNPTYSRGVHNAGLEVSATTNGTTQSGQALAYADMYIFDCGTSTINTSGS